VEPELGVDDLERGFEVAMYEIYDRAGREVGYWASRYRQLVDRRHGLGAARYLLHQRATSDGYRRLREAGRLDLTVEALVLKSRFRPLFTAEEIGIARARLDYYEELAREEAPSGEPDPDLESMLDEAAAAPPGLRVELFRDRVVAFGSAAIAQIEAWVGRGGPVGFAVATVEAIGRQEHPDAAIRALGRLRASNPDWAEVIDAAVRRLKQGTAG
jgi:hypothetical protein